MILKLTRTLYFSGLCFFGVSGCSFFTAPMENPIIEDHSQGMTTWGTIPSRRMVILKPNNDDDAKVFVCAEPSPDVSDNIASSLTAAATGKGIPLGGASAAEITANLSKVLATTAKFLFKRTQGVQLYRDGMYSLCQARMNNTIDNEEFKAQSKALLNESIQLIDREIPYLHARP